MSTSTSIDIDSGIVGVVSPPEMMLVVHTFLLGTPDTSIGGDQMIEPNECNDQNYH